MENENDLESAKILEQQEAIMLEALKLPIEEAAAAKHNSGRVNLQKHFF